MAAPGFSKVGFIGLGAMGKHMVEHLANKLPDESRIYIYDVSSSPVEELASRYPGKVIPSTSSKDVAENAVCQPTLLN